MTESLENFQYWLAHMDDALEQLMAEVPPDLAAQLDFSLDSLLALEPWILEQFPTFDDAMKADSAQLVDRLARYVGETLRKAAAGKWEIRSDDPQYAFYNLPQVTSAYTDPECPLTLVTAATDRRIGTYLHTVLTDLHDDARKRGALQ